jgi:hypothetical protein
MNDLVCDRCGAVEEWESSVHYRKFGRNHPHSTRKTKESGPRKYIKETPLHHIGYAEFWVGDKYIKGCYCLRCFETRKEWEEKPSLIT